MLLRALSFCLLFGLPFSSVATPEDCNDVSISIQAPPDMVVSCCYWFSYSMLLDPANNAFGRIVYDRSKIQKVKTHDKVCESWCNRDNHTGYDPDDVQDGKPCELYNQYYSAAHPDQAYGLVWGWDGYVTNAPGPVQIDIDDRRGCGTGLVIRRISVEEHGVTFYDEQRIWLVDCQPFYVNPDNCFDPDDNIEWPLFCQQPQPLDGCDADLSPDNPLLGRARVDNAGDDQCNLISVDYSDDIITIEGNACLKVLRVWTVIDWCQYHPLKNPHQGRWEYLQVIKVRDKEDPVVSCVIGDCNPSVKDSLGTCYGEIFLRATATDSCTDQNHLRYEYKIDLFNDGNGHDFDLHSGLLTKLDEAPIDMDNPYAKHQDSVNNASGRYPLGTHRIKWFVEDGCGNVALCDTTFEIKDCKLPTPYCKTGIITVLMPANKEIEVWAKDLNDGSFDNCTNQEDLIFSFSEDTADQNKIFSCSELDTNVVRIYVTDEEGNQDFCETIIVIQDSQNNCGGNIQTNIQGMVFSWDDTIRRSLADLDIILFENNVEVERVQGAIMPYDLNIENYNGVLTILPEKNDDHTNGMNTADMIWLQRYLLGRLEMTSNQIVAADVNNDCSLSTADILAMRRLLLGMDDDLSRYDQTSWVFQPLGSSGLDTNDICHSTGRHDVLDNLAEYDFLAIKVGDISGNARNGVNGGIQSRSNTTFQIRYNEHKNRVDLIAKDHLTSSAIFLNMPHHMYNVSSTLFEHIHWNNTSSSTKLMMYNEDDLAIEIGDIIASIDFKEDISANFMDINDSYFVDQTLNARPIDLIAEGIDNVNSAINVDIFPSPANDILYITSTNEIPVSASIDVINLNGMVILSKSDKKIQSKNVLKLNVESLPEGAYFLRVNTEKEVMVVRWLKD